MYQRTIRSVALIIAPKGSGSGFVVNAEQKLVVTNFHVVGAEKQVWVYFPYHDAKGQLVTDPDEYVKRKDELAIRGEVIASDKSCDLALVRLERLPNQVTAIKFTTQPAPTGAVVYSVGGSGLEENLLWRLSKGTVRGRAKRQTNVGFGKMDCMFLETDAPTNRGDSGGPVVNERGELVAVVANYVTKQRLLSDNIDVEEVRKFISRHAGQGTPTP